MLYLMQYRYDPGTLPSSAIYYIPGKVYLYAIHQGNLELPDLTVQYQPGMSVQARLSCGLQNC